MILDPGKVDIEAGKSYKLIAPDYFYVPIKVHIDYILENKKSNAVEDTLIVVRYWLVNKRVWRYKIYEYWHLCLYNNNK